MPWSQNLDEWAKFCLDVDGLRKGYQMARGMEIALRRGLLDDQEITPWVVVSPDGNIPATNWERAIHSEMILDAYGNNKRHSNAVRTLERFGFPHISGGLTSLTLSGDVKGFRKRFSIDYQVELQPIQLNRYQAILHPYLSAASHEIPSELQGTVAFLGMPCPLILSAYVNALPPKVSYNHLELPEGLASCVHADVVHQEGIEGDGIQITILDTGVELDHKYFERHPSDIQVQCVAGAEKQDRDEWGHGTVMAAAVAAIAPKAKIRVMKIPMSDPIKSLREHVTVALRPIYDIEPRAHIVLCAWGFHEADHDRPLDLVSEIASLVAVKGALFVCAAGNLGTCNYPANLPDVLSVGGAWQDKQGQLQASNFTSSFLSTQTGKQCPEISGPSGNQPLGIYLLAPTGKVSSFDVRQSSDGKRYPDGDETEMGDAWCGIGGSSTAAAVVAGVAALILEANPELSVKELKQILIQTADPIQNGKSVMGEPPPMATGAGMVNAYQAVKLVR